MTRYEITLTTPTIGKVKHVIKAQDRAGAIAKAKRAHPGAASVRAKKVAEVAA